jgi:hypothetical protein
MTPVNFISARYIAIPFEEYFEIAIIFLSAYTSENFFIHRITLAHSKSVLESHAEAEFLTV